MKKIKQKIAGLLLIAIILQSVFFLTFFPFKKAEAESISVAAGSFTSCAIGELLANTLATGVSSLVNIFLNIVDPRVTTRESNYTTGEYGMIEWNGIVLASSLNAFAYCIANAMITYIADSTIHWIRNGFEGSPAFIEDPGRTFTELADEEFEGFMESVSEDFFCDAWNDDLKTSLTNMYNNSYRSNYLGSNRCTLEEDLEDYESFISGKDDGDDTYYFDKFDTIWSSPGNNSIESLMLANEAFEADVSNRQSNELTTWNWGRGFVSFRDKEGSIHTPGSVIETQLAKTLGLSKDRLVLAEKFDQVIAELVNSLIKTALDEVLKD